MLYQRDFDAGKEHKPDFRRAVSLLTAPTDTELLTYLRLADKRFGLPSNFNAAR